MYWVIFLNTKTENIKEKNKIRNFLIALILLVITYLFIIFLTEKDNSFDTYLPVSNMESTKNNYMEDMLKDEMYVVKSISEVDEGYEINIYYPYTNDDSLNSYINTKLDLYIKDIKYQASRYDEEVIKGKYTLDISFDVTKGNNNYISYIFYIKQDIKYLHPNEAILSEYTYQELLKNEEIKNMGALDILKVGTLANKYNFMDIAFKDNNMLVIFEKYQVAPYVLGVFEVEVPLEYLENN